jgi:hypothetical protein
MSKIIPFGWLPWTWGMKGSTRARAEAEYNYTGKELDLKLLDIDHEPNTSSWLRKKLEISKKYNDISDKEYAYSLLELSYDKNSPEFKLSQLELDKQYKNIPENEYKKQRATINGEPWVVVLSEYQPGNGLSGLAVELDWNEKFVDQLRQNGYSGVSDEHIVQQWFAEICRGVAEEEGILDDMYPITDSAMPQFGPKIIKTQNTNKTDYS